MIGNLFLCLSKLVYIYLYFSFKNRFYDELDFERRVRKRRAKLLSSCEDAFTHVRKCLNEKYGTHLPMDAREAAQVNSPFFRFFFLIKILSRLFFHQCHVLFKNILD